MKTLLFTFFLWPLISTAQKNLPRFQNDTLYTSSGFKIYKGQTLQFGKGSGQKGKYRFINIKNGYRAKSLANTSVIVDELKNFGISIFYNGYIEIIGTLIFKDGSKGAINIHMAFDRAIENSLALPSELIVPDEYRNKPAGNLSDEIMKLYKLYKEGDLTDEEFEAQKKKLLGEQ